MKAKCYEKEQGFFFLFCETEITSKSLARRSGEESLEISIALEINSCPKGGLEIKSCTKM